MPMAPDLLRLADVAEFLGVSELQARELSWREDFPQPLPMVYSDEVWRRADIDRWARQVRARHRR